MPATITTACTAVPAKFCKLVWDADCVANGDTASPDLVATATAHVTMSCALGKVSYALYTDDTCGTTVAPVADSQYGGAKVGDLADPIDMSTVVDTACGSLATGTEAAAAKTYRCKYDNAGVAAYNTAKPDVDTLAA